jgi:WD40 repeat protein
MAPLYKGFLSYSHAADVKLASALQRGIQHLGKPWYRRPLVRVFRDETSLSANPGLWSGIQKALEQCEYFLLMASVQSAGSPWVQKEVEWWIQHRSVERFLIIVTDGTIVWNPSAADFDWERTTCLPRVLRGRFREEPHYVDLCWTRQGKGLVLRNSRFRTAVLTLAAPLHGRPMDELDGEDIRQQRGFRLAAMSTILVTSLLAVAVASERRSAQDEARKAESRSVAAKCLESLEQGHMERAILLAVFAWRLSPTAEAQRALEKLASSSSDVAKILRQHTGVDIESMAFSPAPGEAPVLATGSSDGSIILWQIPRGTAAGPPLTSDQKGVYELQFSGNGSSLLSRGPGVEAADGGPSDETLVLYDLKLGTGKRVPDDLLRRGSGSLEGATALSPAGHLIAFFVGKKVAVWDATTNGVRYKDLTGDLIGLHFVTDSRLLVLEKPHSYLGGQMAAGLWDLETDTLRLGPVQESGADYPGETLRATFNQDGSRVVTRTFNGGKFLLYGIRNDLNLQQMQFPGNVRLQEDIRFSVALDAEGKRVAVGGERKAAAWDLAEHKVLKEISGPPWEMEAMVAFSRDGRWLATNTESDGKLVVWDLNQQDSQAQGKTFEVACSLAGNNERECIRRLCEKASSLLTDKDLSDALGRSYYERLKTTALSRPCDYP